MNMSIKTLKMAVFFHLFFSSFLFAAQSDLVITDIWRDGSEVCFQVMNIGDYTCNKGFDIGLSVDTVMLDYYAVNLELKPGQRLNGYFTKYQFECGQGETGHLLQVRADVFDVIGESSESNNSRKEYFSCDVTPPVITEGPDVISLDPVKIWWKTDEPGESTVRYGTTANVFESSVTSTTQVTEHLLNLGSLPASTTYNYKAESRDAAGNTVESGIGYFTTPAAADSKQPYCSIKPTVIGSLPMRFYSDAADNEGVDRIEYDFNGTTIWVDYDPPYQCILNPEFLNISHKSFYDAVHNVEARAYDLAGNTFAAGFNWFEMWSCAEVDLWHSSSGPFHATTADETYPGHEIRLNIHAKERNEGIVELPPDPYNPRYPGNRDSVWKAVQEVRVYFKGSLMDTMYPDDPDDYSYVYHLNTGTLAAPSRNEIKIEAISSDGCSTFDTTWVDISRLNAQARVRRDIERRPPGNYFRVDVAVENSGAVPFTISRFVDTITGFQAAFVDDAGGTGTLSFDVYRKQSKMEFAWNEYLEPGNSVTFSYNAVGIMFDGTADYSIGTDAQINYVDDYGREYGPDVRSYINDNASGLRLDVEVYEAFEASDYLMVTNPYNLYGIYDHAGCDLLLSKMSELAVERGAVLGYFNGQSHAHTRYDTNDKIACGNIFGDYRDEIVLMDNDVDRDGANQDNIRIYDGSGHLRSFEHAPLEADDVFLVGNVLPGNDAGREPLDDIVIVTGSGSGRGDFTVYNFNHGNDEFDSFSGSLSFDPSAGDKLCIGDMIVTTPNERSEIIHFRASDGLIRGYYGSGGIPQDSFSSIYRSGDIVAAGELLPAVGDEIVIGDVSENQIVIYNGEDQTEHLRFSCSIKSPDQLIVCDEGLAVVDESANRIDIWRITETGASKAGGFSVTVASNDVVMSGYVIDRPTEQYIFARGSRHDHYSDHDIEIYAYSVYDGTAEPGDRYDLDNLINPGGQWAAQLCGNWLEDGYLMIIGEIEIIPGFACSYEFYDSRHYIEFTDNYYSNTEGNMKFPELSIGRINGNCPLKMAAKIQRCIDIARGDVVLDTSSAYVSSGSDDGNEGDDNRFDDCRRDRAAQLAAGGYITVDQSDQVDDAVFFAGCADRDFIFLTGHGNYNTWDGKTTYELEDNWVAGDGAPVVYGSSCLTGRYFVDENTYCEHWMEFGASAYIGATEVTYSSSSVPLADGFLNRYGPGYPIGLAMKNAKRNRMGSDSQAKYHSAVYHLFGDPKMEPSAAGAMKAAVARAASSYGVEITGPVSYVDLKIPPFEQSWSGYSGFVSITIPGGSELIEYGRPEIPAWPVTVKWPAGYRVQDVYLSGVEYSGGTGLPVKFADPYPNDGSKADPASGRDYSPWPDRALDWNVQDNPDGTSSLSVYVYPFKTWPETTNYTFFSGCRLNIDYHTSSVSVNKLVTDKKVYPAGDTVKADVYLYREILPEKDTLNVIAQAVLTCRDNGSVYGLPVKLLKDVKSLGSFSWDWDSGDAPAGDYELEVVLKNASSGEILDSETIEFRLGLVDGVTDFTGIIPQCFADGEEVSISCGFKNSGQVNINGKIVLEILTPGGSQIDSQSMAFQDLPPGQKAVFEYLWKAVWGRGDVLLRAYTLFDGRQSNIVIWPSISPLSDGDLNSDNRFTFEDIAILAPYWLGEYPAYDIAPLGGDCWTDMLDLAVIIDKWLEMK
jgi:hypothetical protein